MNWYESYSEVVSFARVLDAAGKFERTIDVIYYFEKPWKWGHEYSLWKQGLLF